MIPVTHSTIDCVALAVRTPVGVIIHTGDFKIDHTPVGGAGFVFQHFAALPATKAFWLYFPIPPTSSDRASRLPNVLLCRALKSWLVQLPSESFFRASPRPFIAIQQVIDIASRVGRKVAFVGRSMVDNVENRARPGISAHSRRHGRPLPGHPLIPIRAKIIILASGSQAEPMFSLSRIAVDNHRFGQCRRK